MGDKTNKVTPVICNFIKDYSEKWVSNKIDLYNSRCSLQDREYSQQIQILISNITKVLYDGDYDKINDDILAYFNSNLHKYDIYKYTPGQYLDILLVICNDLFKNYVYKNFINEHTIKEYLYSDHTQFGKFIIESKEEDYYYDTKTIHTLSYILDADIKNKNSQYVYNSTIKYLLQMNPMSLTDKEFEYLQKFRKSYKEFIEYIEPLYKQIIPQKS